MEALVPFDYSGLCWWCSSKPAASAEHKYKRTDIVSEFGRGPYRRDSSLIRQVGEVMVANGLQGPNSGQFKFPIGLCHECNTARSRQADLAYEALVRYIRCSESDILRNNTLNLTIPFGAAWQNGLRNVRRYLAKHLASRIVDAGRRVGDDLIGFLGGGADDAALSVHAEIRADILEALGDGPTRGGSLWLGDFVGWHAPEDTRIVRVQSHYGFGWLRFNWVYDPLCRDWPNNLRSEMVALERVRRVGPNNRTG
jgi:hypothetical protein